MSRALKFCYLETALADALGVDRSHLREWRKKALKKGVDFDGGGGQRGTALCYTLEALRKVEAHWSVRFPANVQVRRIGRNERICDGVLLAEAGEEAETIRIRISNVQRLKVGDVLTKCRWLKSNIWMFTGTSRIIRRPTTKEKTRYPNLK